MLHQGTDIEVGIVDQRHTRVDDLGEVVGWNIGRHADGDAGGTVDQQVRQAGREDRGLPFRFVVVGDEIDRFLVEVGEQLMSDLRHAHFGVAHGRRGVAVDRTEVALPVDEHVAQREWLRHAHDRVVHGGIAMRVVFTDDVADDAGGFFIGFVPVVAQFAHGEQRAPVHGFEPVAHVGQRTSHDYAHGVIEVGLFHLVFEIDGQDFFGEFSHRRGAGPYYYLYASGCDEVPHAVRTGAKPATF